MCVVLNTKISREKKCSFTCVENLLAVPRSPASPPSPKPKCIIMGIDESNPRQLASSVGTGDDDRAIVMAPSTMIFDSSVVENHLLFGTIDFIVHSPATRRELDFVGDGINMMLGG